MDIRIKRVYEPAAPDDGVRILVDRLWPRGVAKTGAGVNQWMKDVAPSTELRKWYGHDVAKWSGFVRRYRAELAGNAGAVGQLRKVADQGPVTLLYAARDEVHNQAVVLRDYLLESDQPSTRPA
jgi:uncharacterized protein YeaO (DUF488 family)